MGTAGQRAPTGAAARRAVAWRRMAAAMALVGWALLPALAKGGDPAAGTAADPLGLHEVDLGGADLRHRVFDRASLVSARLSFVRLDGASFDAADLRYATLTPVGARDAIFTRARLDHVTGNAGTFDGAFFGAARLSGASFVGASFVDARLTDTDLADAAFAYADFTGADLTGARVAGADFFGALFLHTTCPDGSSSDVVPGCGL